MLLAAHDDPEDRKALGRQLIRLLTKMSHLARTNFGTIEKMRAAGTKKSPMEEIYDTCILCSQIDFCFSTFTAEGYNEK